jgi:capsid protein
MFGINKLNTKIEQLDRLNKELQAKTSELTTDNHKMNAILTGFLGYGYEAFTGEVNSGDLPEPKEIVIYYDILRLRSWNFILKNHIADLIVTKRINWQIGTGLLFNAKPSDKPFIDYYGGKTGKTKHREFIRQIEYQFRNYISSKEIDYTRANNLHEMARIVDFNACGDGDILLLMRVKNGYPNIQVISGQCVVNPVLQSEQIIEGNTVNEGVERDGKGEVVAYHVLVNSDTSNGTYTPIPKIQNYGTIRIPVYFTGTKMKQAWLYRASDLQKVNETRAMPILSKLFETLQHVNDYLIANSKNAQLAAQMVLLFEKDASSTGERVFNDNTINVAGMSATTVTDAVASDLDVQQSAAKLEYKMNGNGIVADLPKGVKGKILNPTAQSDQKEYLNSTLRTIFADTGTPYEVMISSYDSNYSASMGARSDYQYNLDVMTEIIPSNQLYKMYYSIFLYLQVLKGDIDCPPLKKAYEKNDIITIQAISNSVFEGTKLKPIDPVKFIDSLRAQLPIKIRENVPLNTIENLINAASGGDYEGVLNQLMNEIDVLPKELEVEPKLPQNGAI